MAVYHINRTAQNRNKQGSGEGVLAGVRLSKELSLVSFDDIQTIFDVFLDIGR